MEFWAMSKFLLAFFGLVMVIGSNAALARHDALETLFENGSLSLASESNCEPYQSAEAPTNYAQSLAQDIAWVINDMADKAIGVEASCDIVSNQKKICKVIFSIGVGELEWARVYQFESVVSKKGSITLKGLSCFNVP
jgi:hypothetical protein